jgi:Bacterial Ig-like domain
MRGLRSGLALRLSLVALVSLAPPVALFAQYEGQEPTHVSVKDLTTTGALYNEKRVIVQGELRYGDSQDTNYNIFELRGQDAIQVVRVGTPAQSVEDLRFKVGQKVEIGGIFFDLSSVMMPQQHPILRYFPGAVRSDSLGFDKQYFIAVTSADIIAPIESDLKPVKPEDEPEIEDPDIDTSSLTDLDLRALVKDPTPFLGKQVSVLGKFRGSNLYGDLSIRDKRTPRDFVIKVADAAIWVTGRRPRGKDFRLDPDKRRDTGEWLRVIGEPWQVDGTVYLKAMKISIAEDPGKPDLEPTKVGGDEEKLKGPPPEVTFTLPIAGDGSIPRDTVFKVQFSKDMKGESFHRNVDLLYADDDGIANPFPDLEVSYDGPSRTLTVKPNKTLDAGKGMRLILYAPIEDTEGQKLLPSADGETEPGAAVVLTFTTARS